jgi:hypothetical protein
MVVQNTTKTYYIDKILLGEIICFQLLVLNNCQIVMAMSVVQKKKTISNFPIERK